MPMRTLHSLSIILTFLLLLPSCNKELIVTDDEQKVEDRKILNGTYTGIFTVKYGLEIITNPVTLKFTNGNFTCSGNQNTIPAGGIGTFYTRYGRITFYATYAVGAVGSVDSVDTCPAFFDINLILHGVYDYSLTGNKLLISTARSYTTYYEYNLEKTDSNVQ